MKITICDICNTQENVTTRVFPYHKQSYEAEKMEEISSKEFDLCLKCYCSALEHTIKEHIRSKRPIDQYRHNAALIKWIERQQMGKGGLYGSKNSQIT